MPVVLIATGGTIASTLGPDGRATATLSGRELLDRLGPARPAGVEVVDLSVAGSWNLGTDGAVAVAMAVRQAAADGADGVVVTHGTDVMEETAWTCELLARSAGIPVVLTGSMRHADDPDYEGARNLADALLVAHDPQAARQGVVVCMGGELLAARHVVKTHATSNDTFRSTGYPHLAAVDGRADGGPVTWQQPGPPPPPLVGDVPGGPVPILMSHWDVDPELVEASRHAGAVGIVVEAGGAGNVNERLVPPLLRAVGAGVPVVVASRCRGGQVEPIYGGPGGFGSLVDHGVVGSSGLTAGKARLALQLLLGPAPDRATAVATTARWFAELGAQA
ncbi:MAG: asparaginase [Actinomycetes bacterium]